MQAELKQGPIPREEARAVIQEKLDFYGRLMEALERDEAYGYRNKKGRISIRWRGT